MVKCSVCKSIGLDDLEDEFVCVDCGAAFKLKLIGFYEEGSNERIEAGEQFEKWFKDSLK